MTAVDEQVREGSREGSSPESAGPESQPENAQRARSLPLPSLAALKPVTQRARAAGQGVARSVNGKDSLIHSQPPTFHEAWRRHHECAGHYEAALLKYPRLVWGYFHLLVIKPLLNLLEWVTESPARLVITAIVLFLIVWFS